MSVATIDNIGGGGAKLVDINPTKTTNGYYHLCDYGNRYYASIPICGYDKVAVYASNSVSLFWVYNDGTRSGLIQGISGSWTPWLSIPDNAICLAGLGNTVSTGHYYFSLLTKESPYNTDNQ